MADSTIQMRWQKLWQASDQAAATALDYTYGATWANDAQNPANWPSGATRVGLHQNGIRMWFAVADDEDDQAVVHLWLKDVGGIPFRLGTLTVTAGANPIEKDPVDGSALTDFFLADTVTLTTGKTSWFQIYSPADDDMAEVRIDLAGASEIYAQADVDAPATNGTDCIIYWKGY